MEGREGEHEDDSGTWKCGNVEKIREGGCSRKRISVVHHFSSRLGSEHYRLCCAY